jgi:hypothetical protein
MITWQTPAGNLGIITERVLQDITLQASTNLTTISYSLITGALPRGLRLTTNGHIVGSPVEVKRFTTSRFVIRANDGADIEDRTFSLSVDGADIPKWITTEGYLNVGPADAYFVLDNSRVEFQLDASDTDLTAGDSLEFYLVPMGGELPPGLSLSKSGLISGFTDPIFALEYNDITSGGYDTAPLDVIPLDFVESRSNGFDSYFYDNQTFDYNEPSRTPRRLSRIYNFVVAVTDGIASVNRLFKIYVVTEEFLQADNSLLQVDTNLFQADSASDRFPLWITESNLGRIRANNYVTIFLDVYDPPTLSGTITYFLLPTNPDASPSVLPPGMELDSITGEIAGRVPYQSAVTKNYTFSLVAVNFPATLANLTYTLVGNWNSSTNYQVNDAVRYLEFIYICTQANKNKVPSTDSDFWFRGVSSADKTFSVDLIGEIESSVEWLTESDRGTIKPNQPSQLYIEAKSLLYGGRIAYDFISGTLPPGLEFLSTGIIQGKVRQFADSQGDGLTRFYDVIEPSQEISYDITFDGGETTFDKVFSFTIRARDAANFAESLRTFTITVIAENNKTFANLYVKAFQSKDKRLNWYNFITDTTIFVPSEIYRYGDAAFGIQTDLKLMVYAGIESVEAVKYVQAMSRNHYRKRLLFGNINVAKSKDPITQETIYEVIYVDVVDEYEKDNKSISQTVNLKDSIKSKVLISYDAIKVDSDVPLVSDADHQRIFPNSIKNMRSRIGAVGDRDREFLPSWMRSIQDTSNYEKGYTKALILCYAKPGSAASIISRINAKIQYASRGEWSATANYIINDTVFYKGFYFTCVADNQNKVPNIETDFWTRNFDFKSIDFTADRYIIDIIDGEIEDKYLAFPQRGEKLP